MLKILFFLVLLTSGLSYAKGIDRAKEYHNHSLLQWNAALDMLENFSCKGNERILDIGCGDGKITAMLANQCPRGLVVGLDISEAMIQFASSLYSGTDFPNLIFLTGDAALLPFYEQFDLVFSFSTLHWVLNQKKALADIYRALLPGGQVCILMYGNFPMNLQTLWEQVIASEKWKKDFVSYQPQRIFFSEGEYKALLEEVGFTGVAVHSKNDEAIFANSEELKNFVRPTLNFIDHLSPEKQNEFIHDLVDKIISKAPRKEDGSIIFQFLMLQAYAFKK